MTLWPQLASRGDRYCRLTPATVTAIRRRRILARSQCPYLVSRRLAGPAIRNDALMSPVATIAPTDHTPSMEKRFVVAITQLVQVAFRARPAAARVRASGSNPPTQHPTPSEWSTSATRCKLPALPGVTAP